MATINSDHTIVTVQKGDTLSGIAQTYGQYIAGSTINDKVNTLVKLNGIPNKDVIAIGQKIKLSGSAPAKNASNMAVINVLGLISDKDDRSVYATWTWDKPASETEHYQVQWFFYTDGKWHNATDEVTTVKSKYSTYNAPSYATSVKLWVKPISKKKKQNGKEVAYWSASKSTEKKYSFSSNPPSQPPVPTVTIDDYKLTARVDLSDDINATEIEFRVYKDDKSKVSSGKAAIKTKTAIYTCTVNAGGSYKVQCRAVRGDEYSEWTAFSSNVDAAPAAPAGFTKIKVVTPTEVQLDWDSVKNATEYEVQWTTKKRYFGSSEDNTPSKTIKADTASSAEITGLETGMEYFFRLRTKRGEQVSPWCEPVSVILGRQPSAPTTWSSKTTITNDPNDPDGGTAFLYWVHNSEDSSHMREAEVEITINGNSETHHYIPKVDEEEEERTYYWPLDITQYATGTKILWRVRTKGISDEYSDWSVQRTVDVYSTPELYFHITNAFNQDLEYIKTFPFYIRATDVSSSSNQKPIGYHVSVMAVEGYETVDELGNEKVVNANEIIYSKYFDTAEVLLLEMSAGNIDLANNEMYKFRCVMSMDSGLTAEAEETLVVLWDEEYYVPNAYHSIDPDAPIVYICPYCKDENENLVDDVLLSVYRREFDGKFTELATGIENNETTYFTDPHPALDYARYRIVATTESTGSVKFYDMPGIPVNEKAVIIQWNEEWTTSFEVTSEFEREEPMWTGSMLKLPYNIDVSDSNKPDVALVEYIGREHPVSYYGTQLGSTSTWNVVIPKNDTATLYALRRLSVWMGDVYVREPSGSGYWANITVSFSQKHRELTIPVTLNITRVAGGA